MVDSFPFVISLIRFCLSVLSISHFIGHFCPKIFIKLTTLLFKRSYPLLLFLFSSFVFVKASFYVCLRKKVLKRFLEKTLECVSPKQVDRYQWGVTVRYLWDFSWLSSKTSALTIRRIVNLWYNHCKIVLTF